MGKKATKQKKAKTHLDKSGLTVSADHAMSPNRDASDSTIIRHDSWEGQTKAAEENPGEKEGDAQASDDDDNEGSTARGQKLGSLEAKIHAAARAVIADVEKDNYGGNDESVLSVQTDESHPSYNSGNEELSELTPDMDTSAISHEHEELMESIERDESDYNEAHGLGGHTEDRVESPSSKSQSENDRGGDSSSHNEGDIDDDDVFSRNSGHSARSSLNSCHGLDSSDEPYGQKALTSPTVGEEAASTRRGSEVSHLESYMHEIPEAVSPSQSKVLARPPFRTPSVVRAMQMSSPTPSVYNTSPRSVKRHLPTVSRIGTPSSHTPRYRTPTRLKAKKEQPLVLLHVTVLPLVWQYSHLMPSSDLPDTLKDVKENWRLLQEKLADTVLERGILIPHPQDSYDVLEERLLEALELPVRPRAMILKCGHYMGPLEHEVPSSDEDADEFWADKAPQRKWCDICRRDIKLENGGEPEKRKFRVKIFASNGLMHAGAWAAAWREMERVDVEIGPWIESAQLDELERMAMSNSKPPAVSIEDLEDAFEDEDEDHEVVRLSVEPSDIQQPRSGEMPSSEDISEMSKDIPEHISEDAPEEMPEIDPEDISDQILEEVPEEIEDDLDDSPEKISENCVEEISEEITKDAPEEVSENIPASFSEEVVEEIPQDMLRNVNMSERHEERARSVVFDESDQPQELEKSVADYEKEMQELLLEEEQMRKRHIHSPEPPIPQRPQPSFNPQPPFNVDSRPKINEDSLSELLVAAGKVAMRDRKNLAILFLSVLVLILALRPVASSSSHLQMADSPAIAPEILHATDSQSNPSAPEALVEVIHEGPVTAAKTSGPQVQAASKKVQQRKSKGSKEAPLKAALKKPPPASNEEAKSEESAVAETVEGMLEGENEGIEPEESVDTMPQLDDDVEEDIQTTQELQADAQEEVVEAIESQLADDMPQAESKMGAEEINRVDMSENDLNDEVGAMEEELENYENEDEAEQADNEADPSTKEALRVPDSSDSSVLYGDHDENPTSATSEREEL